MDEAKVDNAVAKISEERLTEIIENGIRIKGEIIGLSKKGFGFIGTKEIPFTRIFFHWSALEPTTKHFSEIQMQDNVEFEIMEHETKGLRAVAIKVLD